MKRALISVSDKTGIVEFARELTGLGFEILSTGGTAQALHDAGIAVTQVSDVTGFPECLDGRVKTLHPKIHAGILAMRDNPLHMKQINELGVEPIDLVAINLYPFKATITKPDVRLEDAIENIDIGGPTMLRSAAKNYQDVTVLVDPTDYPRALAALKDGGVPREMKFELCYKVFAHTAAYDALVAEYLRKVQGITEYPKDFAPVFEMRQPMRYGENPHQSAMFYRQIGAQPGTLVEAKQLNGKEISYNNIGDADGALALLREFQDQIAVVAVKHANPCGVGIGDNVYEAYMKAYETDPMSIFGGIVATNGRIEEPVAEEMSKIFLEIIIAPAFSDGALRILKRKKNVRVLELPSINTKLSPNDWEMKAVAGGLLVQQRDLTLLSEEELTVPTKLKPTDKQMEDLLFAWKIVKHVKSNAIAIAKDGQSLGVGPGQVNRIWPTLHAIERSGDKVKGAALASDAFFPLDDCVRAAGAAGITAIIQPGGSINDEKSIAACDELGIAMVFAGMRHFKH